MRLRTGVELAVSLIVLVVLFRAFLAGGYMIETGSMAPCLVGYHWRATCPGCRYPFAVEGTRTGAKAVCPNCGKGRIDVEPLPRNDGDHLLVQRGAFDHREPRRWEVVVFKNPNKPTQAYVKRMIGLPGERVEIRDGDIFIDGQIQTKGYATQRGLRIPVYDHDFRPPPDDPDWQPRWCIDDKDGGWTQDEGVFRFAGTDQPTPDGLSPASDGQGSMPASDGQSPIAWVSYRHWVRRAGSHGTSVPLAAWPMSVPQPSSDTGPLTWDETKGKLVCRGALSRELCNQLLAAGGDAGFREAIEQLFVASHIAPISDGYGYNRGTGGGGQNEVRDLMLEARVVMHDRSGLFVVALSDGANSLECHFDLKAGQVRLIDTSTGESLRTAALPAPLLSGPAVVEMSLMDGQALVAVEGHTVFEPWCAPPRDERGPTPWPPVRFGASGMRVGVEQLKLYRDVYYTKGEARRFAGAQRQLGPDEYFVLGDNSPLSRDSRSWTEGTHLTKGLFLGKPLIVHLPSRKSRVGIGPWQTEIRIPEFSRIRYID